MRGSSARSSSPREAPISARLAPGLLRDLALDQLAQIEAQAMLGEAEQIVRHDRCELAREVAGLEPVLRRQHFGRVIDEQSERVGARRPIEWTVGGRRFHRGAAALRQLRPQRLVARDDVAPVESRLRRLARGVAELGAQAGVADQATRRPRRWRRCRPRRTGWHSRNSGRRCQSRWRARRRGRRPAPAAARRSARGCRARHAAPCPCSRPSRVTTLGRPAAIASIGVRPKVSWMLSESEVKMSRRLPDREPHLRRARHRGNAR